jgi:TRAP-type uncharacterized transport system fused permease subunit
MLLALSGFIIPFSFVYDPALLLMSDSVLAIVLRTAAATLGIFMLGAGLIGYVRISALWWERTLLLGGACLLIFPGRFADLAGVACFVVVLLAQRARMAAAAAADRRTAQGTHPRSPTL